jgi:hypothetical protein
MKARLALLGSLALLAACASPDDGTTVTGDEADLTATSGTFSLSLNTLASTGGFARVHGLANQPLGSALAFIPDDEVGTTKLAPKSFTSSFRPNELVLFLGGRPAFFGVTTATQPYRARADLGVKMHISSPVGVKVTSSAESVVVGGVAYVRVKGTFGEPLVAAKTSVKGVDVDGVVSGKSWRFDYPLSFMADAIANKNQIWILLTTAYDDFSGELDATLQMKKTALTTEDPYVVWPAPTCAPTVLTCLQQPANAVDASACGDAFHVLPCWKQAHP